jgi:hypothetical protein
MINLLVLAGILPALLQSRCRKDPILELRLGVPVSNERLKQALTAHPQPVEFVVFQSLWQ